MATSEQNNVELDNKVAMDGDSHAMSDAMAIDKNGNADVGGAQPSFSQMDGTSDVLSESDRLKELTTTVRDQADLERDVAKQVRPRWQRSLITGGPMTNNMQAESMLMEQANERDQRRMEKATVEKRYVTRRAG